VPLTNYGSIFWHFAGHSTYCYAELVHHFSTSSITACHLLDFMEHGNITEADAPTIHLDATPSGLSVPPPPSSAIFTPDALSVATLPVYSGLTKAPNNSGLHTEWLGFTLDSVGFN